jgi:hypothetical protein
MEMIIEYGCEECGAQVMKSATAPLGPTPPKGANRCDVCGHVTDVSQVKRFQWPPVLRSIVDKLCNPEEQGQLRRDPATFVNSTLNTKLRAAGQPEVEVDATSTPVTLRVKATRPEVAR